MSSELIPVGQGQFPVKARDVHSFLAVGRDFPTWMRARLDGFSQGRDYAIQDAPQNGGAASTAGGSNRIDYFLSVDTAKHICMIERNEKGKELRQWFIDRENKLAQVEQTAIDPASLSRLDILRMAIDSEEQRVALAKENQVLTPKAEAFDHFIAKDDAYNIEQAANLLGIGPRELWDVMKDAGHIYRRNTYGKSAQWIPAQRLKRANYLTYKETPFTNDDGQTFHNTKVFVTGRGVEWYRKNLRKFGLIEAPQLKAVN